VADFIVSPSGETFPIPPDMSGGEEILLSLLSREGLTSGEKDRCSLVVMMKARSRNSFTRICTLPCDVTILQGSVKSVRLRWHLLRFCTWRVFASMIATSEMQQNAYILPLISHRSSR